MAITIKDSSKVKITRLNAYPSYKNGKLTYVEYSTGYDTPLVTGPASVAPEIEAGTIPAVQTLAEKPAITAAVSEPTTIKTSTGKTLVKTPTTGWKYEGGGQPTQREVVEASSQLTSQQKAARATYEASKPADVPKSKLVNELAERKEEILAEAEAIRAERAKLTSPSDYAKVQALASQEVTLRNESQILNSLLKGEERRPTGTKGTISYNQYQNTLAMVKAWESLRPYVIGNPVTGNVNIDAVSALDNGVGSYRRSSDKTVDEARKIAATENILRKVGISDKQIAQAKQLLTQIRQQAQTAQQPEKYKDWSGGELLWGRVVNGTLERSPWDVTGGVYKTLPDWAYAKLDNDAKVVLSKLKGYQQLDGNYDIKPALAENKVTPQELLVAGFRLADVNRVNTEIQAEKACAKSIDPVQADEEKVREIMGRTPLSLALKIPLVEYPVAEPIGALSLEQQRDITRRAAEQEVSIAAIFAQDLRDMEKLVRKVQGGEITVPDLRAEGWTDDQIERAMTYAKAYNDIGVALVKGYVTEDELKSVGYKQEDIDKARRYTEVGRQKYVPIWGTYLTWKVDDPLTRAMNVGMDALLVIPFAVGISKLGLTGARRAAMEFKTLRQTSASMRSAANQLWDDVLSKAPDISVIEPGSELAIKYSQYQTLLSGAADLDAIASRTMTRGLFRTASSATVQEVYNLRKALAEGLKKGLISPDEAAVMRRQIFALANDAKEFNILWQTGGNQPGMEPITLRGPSVATRLANIAKAPARTAEETVKSLYNVKSIFSGAGIKESAVQLFAHPIRTARGIGTVLSGSVGLGEPIVLQMARAASPREEYPKQAAMIPSKAGTTRIPGSPAESLTTAQQAIVKYTKGEVTGGLLKVQPYDLPKVVVKIPPYQQMVAQHLRQQGLSVAPVYRADPTIARWAGVTVPILSPGNYFAPTIPEMFISQTPYGVVGVSPGALRMNIDIPEYFVDPTKAPPGEVTAVSRYMKKGAELEVAVAPGKETKAYEVVQTTLGKPEAYILVGSRRVPIYPSKVGYGTKGLTPIELSIADRYKVKLAALKEMLKHPAGRGLPKYGAQYASIYDIDVPGGGKPQKYAVEWEGKLAGDKFDDQGNIIEVAKGYDDPGGGYTRRRVETIAFNQDDDLIVFRDNSEPEGFFTNGGGELAPRGDKPKRKHPGITPLEGSWGQMKSETNMDLKNMVQLPNYYGKTNRHAVYGSYMALGFVNTNQINLKKYLLPGGQQEIVEWRALKPGDTLYTDPGAKQRIEAVLELRKNYSAKWSKGKDSLIIKVHPKTPKILLEKSSLDNTWSRRLKKGDVTGKFNKIKNQAGYIGVPAMITKKMELELARIGYSQSEIDKMTPKEAWDKIGSPQAIEYAKVNEEFEKASKMPDNEAAEYINKRATELFDDPVEQEIFKAEYLNYLDRIYMEGYHVGAPYLAAEALYYTYNYLPKAYSYAGQPEGSSIRTYYRREPKKPAGYTGKTTPQYGLTAAEYPTPTGRETGYVTPKPPSYITPAPPGYIVPVPPSPPTAPAVPTAPVTPTAPSVPPYAPAPPKPPYGIAPKAPKAPQPVIILSGGGSIKKKPTGYQGAVAWRQGQLKIHGKLRDVWHILKPPFKSEADHEVKIGKLPEGVTPVKGGAKSAYRSIQLYAGSVPPSKLKVDLGIVDIEIDKPTAIPGKMGSIKYTADTKQETYGDVTIGKGEKVRSIRGSTVKGLSKLPLHTTLKQLLTIEYKSEPLRQFAKQHSLPEKLRETGAEGVANLLLQLQDEGQLVSESEDGGSLMPRTDFSSPRTLGSSYEDTIAVVRSMLPTKDALKLDRILSEAKTATLAKVRGYPKPTETSGRITTIKAKQTSKESKLRPTSVVSTYIGSVDEALK